MAPIECPGPLRSGSAGSKSAVVWTTLEQLLEDTWLLWPEVSSNPMVALQLGR